MQMSFQETVSGKSLNVQTKYCISCLGGLVSDDLAGEEAGSEDPRAGVVTRGLCL